MLAGGESLAYRGNGSGRPPEVTVPVSAAPMLQGRQLRKHWRYAGVWGPTVSICVAEVRVGPLRQEFWAVWLRGQGHLHQRTRLTTGRVHVEHDRIRVDDQEVAIDLRVTALNDSVVEVVTPVGGNWTWTRKVAAQATGHVRLGTSEHLVDAPAMIEDNGGYHPRRTHWRWAAGAGTLADGRSAMWNQVVGLNDRLPHTENTVWIDGRPTETGLAEISTDLSDIAINDANHADPPARLMFGCEVDRHHTTNLGLVRSHYRAPFGTFRGSLPGGVELVDGYGVMEDHHAIW